MCIRDRADADSYRGTDWSDPGLRGMYFQTGPGWKIQTMSGYGTCAEKILNIMFVKGKNVIILNMLSIFSYKQQEGIQMYDIIIIGAGPCLLYTSFIFHGPGIQTGHEMGCVPF